MNLPEEYLAWIESIDTSKEFCFKGGTVIKLYSKPELEAKYSSASNYFEKNVFVNEKQELIAEAINEKNLTTNYLFTIERISKCITIGESNNNFVFTDPFDNYSVWSVILVNQCVFEDNGNIYDIIKHSHEYNA